MHVKCYLEDVQRLLVNMMRKLLDSSLKNEGLKVIEAALRVCKQYPFIPIS